MRTSNSLMLSFRNGQYIGSCGHMHDATRSMPTHQVHRVLFCQRCGLRLRHRVGYFVIPGVG